MGCLNTNMESTIEATPLSSSPYKIYKIKSIRIGTLLGGPLVTGYLMAVNFKAFNEPGNAKKAWTYSILSTILIFSACILIPLPDKFPNILIPLAYTGIAEYIAKRYQGANIDAHINAGYQTYTLGRALWISMIGLAVICMPVVVYVYTTKPSVSYTVNTYGPLKNEIVFDKKNIVTADVDTLANALTKTGVFKMDHKMSVFVKTEGSKYVIAFVLINNAWNDTTVIDAFSQIRNQLQGLFPKNKIVITLSTSEDIADVKKRIE
jgi:hypothetical protein